MFLFPLIYRNYLADGNSKTDAEIIMESPQYKKGFTRTPNKIQSSYLIPLLLDFVEEKDDTCYSEIMKNRPASCETDNIQEMNHFCLRFTECYMNITGHNDPLLSMPISDEEKVSKLSQSTYSTFTLFTTNWKQICAYSKQSELGSQTSQYIESLFDSIINATNIIEGIHQEFNESGKEIKNNTKGVAQEVNISRQKLIQTINSLINLNLTTTRLKTILDSSNSIIKKIQPYGILLIVCSLLAPRMFSIAFSIILLELLVDLTLAKYCHFYNSFKYRDFFPWICCIVCFYYCAKNSLFFKYIFQIFKKKQKYHYRFGPAIIPTKRDTVKYSRYYHPQK